MINKNKLASELEVVAGIKSLAQAYEEISVMKMQRVRSTVLTTREFLNRLSIVFFDVKTSYKDEIEKYIKEQKKAHTFLAFNKQKSIENKKNGKTLSIFISANGKLYGDIILKVFRLFIEDLKREPNDIVIIGKLGRELYGTGGILRTYQYFDLPDTHVTLEDLKPIISYILAYDQVKVYYGKFSNVITQLPEEANVTGDEPLLTHLEPISQDTQPELQNASKKQFFKFEPSLEYIIQVFESQLVSLLLKQTMNESELARHASRIRAMEEALGNISTQEAMLHIQARRLRAAIDNKKQMNTLSGISLWNK